LPKSEQGAEAHLEIEQARIPISERTSILMPQIQ
jgi:hypothetical protein